MQGNPIPQVMDDSVIRSQDVVQLLDNKPVVNNTAFQTEGVICQAFRRFLLYLKIKSTGTPTTIRFEAQFLDPQTGNWHTYKQGPFAALYYEDQDTAGGINECLEGECMGRQLRVQVTGDGCTDAAYFTTSVAVELRN